jgi:HEPN domain-containing protein/predicted nucleotidyltransferase
MKTTITHIPPQQRSEVLEAVDIIKEVVDPEMIILFGSYARGKFVFDKYRDKNGTVHEYVSDIDILVITQGNTKAEYDIDNEVNQKTDHFKPAVSLQITEIDYINQGLEVGQFFYSDIIKEGILLYDKGTVTLAEKKELSKEEEKQLAQQYYDQWFPRAAGFFRSAKFNLSHAEFKIAAFELHQAAESLYYSILLVFTGYKAKVHNLYKLRKQAHPYSQELFDFFPLEKDKDERTLFELLKRGYIEARYGDYEITTEQLEAIVERVEKMQVLVERICQEKLASIA